ncbi:MAG: AAA family ATPase [Candidatus Dormibacteria bacterium]
MSVTLTHNEDAKGDIASTSRGAELERTSTDPRARSYRRQCAALTSQPVLHSSEKESAVAHLPLWSRRRGRADLEAQWRTVEARAAADAEEVIRSFERCSTDVLQALGSLAAVRRPRLFGKVEGEQTRVQRCATKLGEARQLVAAGDFGGAGKAVEEAERHLFAAGGPLMAALNQELAQAAFPRARREELQRMLDGRREAQQEVTAARERSVREGLLAAATTFDRLADFLRLCTELLKEQASGTAGPRVAAADSAVRVVSPTELETFDDVGGLDEVKARLRRSAAMVLERSRASGGGAHNGILLYGPPGTGKTLLARALAGEFGLRFVRFSPAAIASAYAHEPVRKLRELFSLAASSTPALLLLDEIDVIGGRRDTASGPETREITSQLLTSLEDHQGTPGLIIVGATNRLDSLDAALSEGRFDSRIAVPMPSMEERRAILDVLLRRRGHEVSWEALNVDELAQRTSGRSGAALASLVAGAAEAAQAHGGMIRQEDVLVVIDERSGQDRSQTFEERVTWSDVVLPEATQERLHEILMVFQNPDLGRQLGVHPPAGILLYGPPGSGKTTIAKALATEVRASFYEQSAADLLSKFVGESEERVARLFTRARENRPSIIFIDEIDALLKRRSAESAAPWEERVVSQFLRELDGLVSMTGVLLVGATNRLDIIDEAVRERRLAAVEVPLPDGSGRRRLLELLCEGVRLADDVDLGEVAGLADGLSGADLKAIRNTAGMKALSRAARTGDTAAAAVRRVDFLTALAERGLLVTPD